MTDSIIFLIDKSSSVQSYAKGYLDAINGIIEAQKKIKPNTVMTCVTFNEDIEYLFINFPLFMLTKPIGIDDLKPAGLTAFNDNVSAIIRKMLEFFTIIQQKPPVVIILTDGEDTCSKILSRKHTALQIAIAKTEGWQFIYLAPTEKSMQIGRELGCNTCILYTCSENSFAKIPAIISKLLSEMQIPDAEIDISDISKSLMNMKIN